MHARLSIRPLSLAGLLAISFVCGLWAPALGQTSTLVSEKDAPVALFSDFLHFARIGRFTEAKAYADKLLAVENLDTTELVAFADRDRDAVPTLLTLIRHTSLSDTAQKMLDLVREGEFRQREDKERILTNLEKLGGPPQIEFNAIQRLKESGEYAIPELIGALLDPGLARLHPRILRALPQLGLPAVGPLVQALQTDNPEVRRYVVVTLGEIGYAHAAPYLLELQGDSSLPAATSAAIDEALARIAATSGRPLPRSAAEGFVEVSEAYYTEQTAVRADPRVEQANVWFWRDGGLVALRVPTEIFGAVMAMRLAERTLILEPAHPGAIALWLAGNFRREARLGLNVESAEDEATDADPTRPESYPRSIYFARAAGPVYAQLVLQRALQGGDKDVALGAIAALDVTAGEAALVGTEGHSRALVEALRFPDAEVRIKAAIALAGALPRSAFGGADLVGPVLAEALRQGSAPQYVVAVGDAEVGNRIANELRELGARVVVDANFLAAMARARQELPAITGFVLGGDLAKPTITVAVETVRRENVFARTPIVALNMPGAKLTPRDPAMDLPGVDIAESLASGEEVRALVEGAAKKISGGTLDAESFTLLALRAARVIRTAAIDGRGVINLAPTVPALVERLAGENQELQVAAAQALALLDDAAGQKAIAELALLESNAPELRMAAFSALAESARRWGNQLTDEQVGRVVTAAKETADLVMRTSASEALGALNLKNNQASDIIRSFHQS